MGFFNTPTLGLTYKPINKIAGADLDAVQRVISVIQQIGCKEIIPKLVYEIQKTPINPNQKEVIKSEDAFNMITTQIAQTIKGMQVSDESKLRLLDVVTKLAETVINTSSVNGVVDQATIKQNMIDVLKSFCPDSMMGTYVPPPPQHLIYTGKVTGDVLPQKITYTDKKMGAPPLKMKTITAQPMMKKTISTFGSTDDSMSQIIDSVKNFGSMENFGNCGSNIFIVILLIILAIIGFVLYKNRDTIKMPTLSQRIAMFGRQIKSIKRM